MKKNQTVLITGGAGFIGSHCAKALDKEGYNIIIVDNFNDYYEPKLKKDRIKKLLAKTKFKLYKLDIVNYKKLREVFLNNKIDIVLHQAAQAGVRYSIENPFVYQKSNIEGTLNILECCREFKVKKLVYASSSSVYGSRSKVPFKEEDNTDFPVSLYAASKKATEALCYSYHSLYNINMVGLRYFTVYGPWGRPDMALFGFTDKILKNKKIDIYGQGKMKRNFTYIDDIVSGIVLAIKADLKYEIFNLGYDSPTKLMYFVEIIEKTLNKKAKKNFLTMQKGDVPITHADISKAKKLLKFQPKTPIEEGVKNFITWYSKYYNKEI
ncbi:MAG: NAD-dependent epimerase/dehydratase family protein [Parcubacteria group bacterium]